jgi:hypothetical protein
LKTFIHIEGNFLEISEITFTSEKKFLPNFSNDSYNTTKLQGNFGKYPIQRRKYISNYGNFYNFFTDMIRIALKKYRFKEAYPQKVEEFLVVSIITEITKNSSTF